jgi:hypothetical protein
VALTGDWEELRDQNDDNATLHRVAQFITFTRVKNEPVSDEKSLASPYWSMHRELPQGFLRNSKSSV